MEGFGHKVFTADLTKTEDLDKLVESIDKLDGLVNNAGIGGRLTPIKFIKEEELEKTLRINTIAPVLLTQKIYRSNKFNKKAI